MMYYRYTDAGARIPVDLDNTQKGTLFLAGGAPSLMNENISKLAEPGVSVLAMNNTASVIPGVDYWVGCDKPACYSPRILLDPKLTKFAIIAKRDFTFRPDQYREYKLRDCPNIFFLGTHEKFTANTLLKKDRDFVWWKNTFWVALQIAYRLGYRKVYLIGCSFNVGKEKNYSYDFKLDDYQQNYNQRLYDQTVTLLELARQHFDESGFEVISATPDSKLNDIYPAVSFDEAIADAQKGFPQDYDIKACKHSSEFKQEALNGNVSRRD